MTNPAMEIPTRRVDMWYAGTSPQRRATVGFRIILAIPQLIILYILFIALVIVVVIGWFGALFMGRFPGWAHAFASGVIRWATRVGAYLFLLTDRYPPFSLEDEAYPARPMLPPAGGRLNRWSVFFRIILAIPASVFYEVVLYGLTFPLLIVMWLVVLIRGAMPEPLYDAYAALLRYEVRYQSWFMMLTSEYPWGMLGDPAGPMSPAASAPAPATGPGTAVPGHDASAALLRLPRPPAPGRRLRRRSRSPTRPPASPQGNRPLPPTRSPAWHRPPTPPPCGRHPCRRRPPASGPCPHPRTGSAPSRPCPAPSCHPGAGSSCREQPGVGWSSPSCGAPSCSSGRTSRRTCSWGTTTTTATRRSCNRRTSPSPTATGPARAARAPGTTVFRQFADSASCTGVHAYVVTSGRTSATVSSSHPCDASNLLHTLGAG